MTNKDEITNYIKALAEQNVISKEELISAYDSGSYITKDKIFTKKIEIVEVLYYIGGLVVLLGLIILIYQNWDSFAFSSKILSTLGAGIISYFVALIFSNDERTETASAAFYVISALVIPIGIFVLLDNSDISFGVNQIYSLVASVMLAIYLLSFFLFKKSIFALFSIIFGTWLFFSFTNMHQPESTILSEIELFEHRLLIVGISYILLGYKFSKNSLVTLKGILYGFGIFSVLFSIFLLSGWAPKQNLVWELIYPFLIGFTIYISISIKSKEFLVWGTLFLMLFLFKITSEYFTNSLGWPLALVLVGFAMIIIGYVSYFLNKKYIVS